MDDLTVSNQPHTTPARGQAASSRSQKSLVRGRLIAFLIGTVAGAVVGTIAGAVGNGVVSACFCLDLLLIHGDIVGMLVGMLYLGVIGVIVGASKGLYIGLCIGGIAYTFPTRWPWWGVVGGIAGAAIGYGLLTLKQASMPGALPPYAIEIMTNTVGTAIGGVVVGMVLGWKRILCRGPRNVT